MTEKAFKSFRNDNYIYVIAEIGINHNGSLDTAKQLIDLAKSIGCDAVKFQKRTIDIVYSKKELEKPRESPWGSTQGQQKYGLELSMNDYDEIHNYCQKKDIDWFASSWDENSQIQMRKYNFKFNKIASAMATNKSFVELVASEGIPTFASTGMTTIDEIDWLVNIFKEKNCELMLMHTVSTYPSLEEDLNLKCIDTLKERYNLPIGYSGHEVAVSPSIVAATLGARAIERHITLDRAMYGSDQSASLQPEGFSQLVGALRRLPKMLGDGDKRIIEEEKTIATKLRYWNKS